MCHEMTFVAVAKSQDSLSVMLRKCTGPTVYLTTRRKHRPDDNEDLPHACAELSSSLVSPMQQPKFGCANTKTCHSTPSILSLFSTVPIITTYFPKARRNIMPSVFRSFALSFSSSLTYYTYFSFPHSI